MFNFDIFKGFLILTELGKIGRRLICLICQLSLSFKKTQLFKYFEYFTDKSGIAKGKNHFNNFTLSMKPSHIWSPDFELRKKSNVSIMSPENNWVADLVLSCHDYIY